MSGHGFTSAFAAQLDAYLEFKQSMGFYGASRIWYLQQFDAWCAGQGRTVFDQATVEEWVAARLESSGRYRSWMSYIRDFGRWLQATGHRGAYVLSDRWKAAFVPPRPYLLTRREIDGFFTAAALDTSSPWRWQAAAFFTLMHSCGLRTGETRALKTAHVNRDYEDIDIVWSKGNRGRRLPVTPQVADVLARCDKESRARFPGRANFFVSGTGNQVIGATVALVLPGSGMKPGWPGHWSAGSRCPAHSGITSPTRASSGGGSRAKTCTRCCLTCRGYAGENWTHLRTSSGSTC
jgi:integrase